MRGIGCLLTGVELFPGNIQGGSDTPAGWAKRASRSTRRSRTTCRRTPATRTRFGSLEFGVMVPDRADTWTRMVYAGAEQAARADRRPVPDVRQALRPRARTGRALRERAGRRARTTSKKVGAPVSAEDRQLLDEHATFVREMEQELQAAEGQDVGPRRCRSWSRA